MMFLKVAVRGPLARTVWRALFFSAAVLTLLHSRTATARNVTLAWTPSPSSLVAGYNVCYGTASGNHDLKVFVTDTNVATINGLTEGRTYYFVVKARDTFGLESLPSNEIAFTVPGFSLTARALPFPHATALHLDSVGPLPAKWIVEASPDFVAWKAVTKGTNPVARVAVVVSDKPAMFFRFKSSSPGLQLTTGRIETNAFPDSFFITSKQRRIPWELEASGDLSANWRLLASGSNTAVNIAVILSSSPSMFFRLRGE